MSADSDAPNGRTCPVPAIRITKKTSQGITPNPGVEFRLLVEGDRALDEPDQVTLMARSPMIAVQPGRHPHGTTRHITRHDSQRDIGYFGAETLQRTLGFIPEPGVYPLIEHGPLPELHVFDASDPLDRGGDD